MTGTGSDRHYCELCALSELKNALRPGDIWVRGSRRFKGFEDYLASGKNTEGTQLKAIGPQSGF